MGVIVAKKQQYQHIDPEDFSTINIESYTKEDGVQPRSVFSHRKHWTRLFAPNRRGRETTARDGE